MDTPIRHVRCFTMPRGTLSTAASIGQLALAAFLVAGCFTAAHPAASPSPVLPATGTPVITSTSGLTVNAPRDIAVVPRSAPTTRTMVLSTADDLVGTRYRYGGTTPAGGFDCSGFVRWVFSQHGIDLPRTARAMGTAGHRIPARRTELAPGDLLLFAERGARVSHVAIYLGDGRIVHASSGQGEVRYDDLDSARGRWFRRHVVSARRVLATD